MVRTAVVVAAFTLLCLGAQRAQAFILDWNAPGIDWTTGWGSPDSGVAGSFVYTRSQSFTNVNGSGVNITITVRLEGADGVGGLDLDDSSAFTGINGNNTNQSLALNPDWGSNNPATSFINVTIAFSQPVGAVAFDLFDVDRSTNDSWHDRITELDILLGDTAAIVVTPLVPANFTEAPVAPTDPAYFIEALNTPASGGVDFKRRGDAGTGVDPVSGGNINVNYVADTDGLSSVTFQYAPGSKSASNPSSQGIGLGNITFTPVPEAGTFLLPAVLIGAWLLQRRLRAAKAHQASIQA